MHVKRIAAFLLCILLILSPSVGDSFDDSASAYKGDVIKVRELFEKKNFMELNALLESYQLLSERDIRWEFAVKDGFYVFHVTNPYYKVLLDEWVASHPGSWVPLVSRANYYDALGWKARGTKRAKDTSEDQVRRMHDNLSITVRDATAALKIKTNLLAAYLVLMGVDQTIGDHEDEARLTKKALGYFPDSYFIRLQHILTLTPRWGGSYEAMERFVEEAAPHVEKNPILKTLPGFVFWDQAGMAEINKQPDKAIELYEKALSYGQNNIFLSSLAEAYLRVKMYDKALQPVDRAIELRPTVANSYALRSKILSAQEKWNEALQAIRRMEEIRGPDSDDVVDVRKWVSNSLVAKGHSDFKSNLPTAIERYTLSLQFFPENAEACCWRGVAYNRTGNSNAALDDLRKAISLNPRLYRAYCELDAVLFRQGGLDEIIELWTKFLDLEPNNAAAYLERSGTYYHKRDFASSLRDAAKACELGNTEACQRMNSIPK